MKLRTRKLAWLLSVAMVISSVNPGMMVMASEGTDTIGQIIEEVTNSIVEEDVASTEEVECAENNEIEEDIIAVGSEECEEQLLMLDGEQSEYSVENVAVYADKDWSIVGESEQTIEGYYGTSFDIGVKVNNDNNVLLHYKWEVSYYVEEDGEFSDYGDNGVGIQPEKAQVYYLYADRKYRCTVYDDFGNEEKVNIYVKCTNTLQIPEYEKNISVRVGSDMLLKAVAISSKEDAQFTYEWSTEDGDDILGTDQTYIKNKFKKSDRGGYKCKISDGYSIVWVLFEVYIDSGLKIDTPKQLEIENGETRTFSASVMTDMDNKNLQVEVSKYDSKRAAWTVLTNIDLTKIIVTGTNELQVYRIFANDGVTDCEAYTVIGSKDLLNSAADTREKAKIISEQIEEQAVILDNEGAAYFKFVPTKAGKWAIYSNGKYDTYCELYDTTNVVDYIG